MFWKNKNIVKETVLSKIEWIHIIFIFTWKK